MKKRVLISVIVLIMFVFIYFINAIDILPTSFSVEKNVSVLYGITVDNTNPGKNANITQVNITIPGSFTFVEGSNATSSLFESFVNTSTVLSWTNSSVYLINGSELESFSFNAIASTFGEYNITVTSVNATGTFSRNISVKVSDNTDPSISFISPTPSSNAKLDQSYIPVNVTASDNIAIDTITLELRNSTGLVSSKISSSSPYFFNFTSLPYDAYTIRAEVNDTSGNTDSTTRAVILGNTTVTPCTPDWNCAEWSECTNEAQTRTCTDSNSCGVTTGKPAENQSCTSTCTTDWNCTAWIPETCPKNEIQNRTCTDSNNCGNDTDKPDETQSCIYEKNSTWLFVIITIIILIILGFVALLYLKNKNQQEIMYQETGY